MVKDEKTRGTGITMPLTSRELLIFIYNNSYNRAEKYPNKNKWSLLQAYMTLNKVVSDFKAYTTQSKTDKNKNILALFLIEFHK